MPNFTRNIKPYVHAELAATRQARSRGQWEESFAPAHRGGRNKDRLRPGAHR